MAINPLIALQGRQVQVPNIAGNRMANAHADLYEQQAAKTRADAADEQVIGQVLQQAGGQLSPQVIQQVAAKSPNAAMKLQQIVSKQAMDQRALTEADMKAKQAGVALEKDQFELQSAKMKRFANRLSTIKDDTTLRRAIYGALADGDIEEGIGQQFLQSKFDDPATRAALEQFQGMVTDAQTKMEAQYKAAEEARRAAAEGRAVSEEQRKQQEFAATLPGKQAEAQYSVAKVKGETPEQKLAREQLARQQAADAEARRSNMARESLTARGQNMTDTRAREQNAISAAGLKPMSAEAAKVFTIAETMIPELEELKREIQANPRTAAAGILTGTNTHLARLASNAADKVGRLRSGGAVNPKEEERFMGQIVRAMDLVNGDPSAATQAIDGLISEARGVVQQVRPQRGAPAAPPSAPSAAPAGPPKVGAVDGGYMFMGGNPADSKSWKKVR